MSAGWRRLAARAIRWSSIKKIVRWEDFRADIEAVTEKEPEERRSNAGRTRRQVSKLFPIGDTPWHELRHHSFS